LQGPDGQPVFSQQVLRDPGTFRLPATGTYTLRVGGGATNLGPYGFTVSAVPAPQAFAIRVGDLVQDGLSASGSGRLESSGSVDSYTFPASAGQRVYARLLTGLNGQRWSLVAPSGQTLFARDLTSDAGLLSLPEDGTYTLWVGGSPDARGAYSFQLTTVPAASSYDIALGDTVSDGVPAAGAGRVEGPDGLDVYSSSASAGQAAYVQLTQGYLPGQHWTLQTPSGRVLASRDLYGDMGLVRFPETGTYRLLAGGGPSPLGPYGFKLWTIPAAQAFAISVGTGVSDGLPSVGAGRLESPGSLDVYTFTGSAGGLVYAQLTSGPNGQRWALRAPDGSTVFDRDLNQDAGVVRLPADGTYTLTVGTPGNPSTGAYSFRLSDVPAAVTYPVAETTSVSDGVPSPGAGRVESAGAEDVYSFTGMAGDAWGLSWSCSYGFAWSLVSPEGSPLGSGTSCSTTTTVLPVTGTYLLHVRASGATTGVYSFNTTATAGTAPAAGPTPTPVSVGDTLTSSISPTGDQDVYTLTGTAGSAIWFHNLLGDNHSLHWRLFDPSGNQVFDRALTSYDAGQRVDFVQSGTYRVYVDGYSGSTGDYAVRLEAVPATQVHALDVPSTVTDGAPDAGAGRIESSGATDSYTFTPVAGSTLWFRNLTDVDRGLRWRLRDPRGSVVFDRALSPYDPGQSVSVDEGPYRLEVAGPGRPATGAYSFSVTTAPAAQVFALTPGTVVSDQSPSAGAGRIEVPGAQDVYTVAATAGQRTWFHNLTDVDTGLRWRLRDPGGQVVFERGLNRYDAGQPVTFDQTGTYRVEVDGATTQTGAYSVGLDPVADPQAFTLNVGDQVRDQTPAAGAGRIEGPGGQDVYSVTGLVGQTVWFRDLTDQDNGLRWRLRDPRGNVVLDRSLYPNEIGQSYTFGLTGAYHLEVDAGGGRQTGTYALALQPVAAPQVFPLTVGTLVSDGAPVEGAGRVEGPGSQDAYTFAGTTGQQLFFRDLTDTDRGLRWRLRDPRGNVLWETGLTPYDAGRSFQLPLGGTYRLEVDGSTVQTGPYSFSVLPVPAPDTSVLFTGTTPPATPVATNGRVETPGAVDVYTFSVLQNTDLFLHNTSDLDRGLRWRLVSPAGRTVFDQALAPGYEVGDVLLQDAGSYRLEAYGTGASTGSYSFTVNQVAVPKVFDLPVGSSVGSDDPGPGAGVISVPGERDSYRFSADVGTVVSVTSDMTLNHDLRWVLQDPLGRDLFNDYLGVGSSHPSLVLNRPGEYRLTVYGNRDSTGTYSLHTTAGPQASVPPVLTPQNFLLPLHDVTTIQTDSPGPGAGILERSDAADVYAFSLESGQALSIAVNAPGALVSIRTPSGRLLSDHAFCTCASGVLIADERGTYTLAVYGASRSMTYSATLARVPTIDEAALPGQARPVATLTRLTPALTPQGGYGTLTVYGRDVPDGGVVTLTAGTSSLPVSVIGSAPADSDFETAFLTLRVDATHAQPGVYDVKITFPDGSKLSKLAGYTVTALMAPSVTTTIDGPASYRVGAVNRTFVNLVNTGTGDYWDDVVQLSVPGNVDISAALPSFPKQAYVDLLTKRGVSQSTIDKLTSLPFPQTVSQQTDASGNHVVTVMVVDVPAGSAVTIPVNVTPKSTGDATVSVIRRGSAPTPSPTPGAAPVPPHSAPGQGPITGAVTPVVTAREPAGTTAETDAEVRAKTAEEILTIELDTAALGLAALALPSALGAIGTGLFDLGVGAALGGSVLGDALAVGGRALVG
ncbi:MAG: hypothetical protein H7233_02070, partial [Pseudorhodobacter sp.]|nr:hypothetical protein [Frankiaceae bacterium]